MFDELIINHVWFGISIWAVTLCSDHVLTLVGARYYTSGVNTHLIFESYELTPRFKRDVEELRWMSPSLLLQLTFVALLLWLIWFLVQYLSWVSWRWNIYRVILGAVLLVQLAIHERHISNIVLFAYTRNSRGIRGRIEYAQWLSYRLSFAKLFSFAVMFFLLFLLTESWYFVGGAGNCLAQSLNHLAYSFKTGPADTGVDDGHSETDEFTL